MERKRFLILTAYTLSLCLLTACGDGTPTFSTQSQTETAVTEAPLEQKADPSSPDAMAENHTTAGTQTTEEDPAASEDNPNAEETEEPASTPDTDVIVVRPADSEEEAANETKDHSQETEDFGEAATPKPPAKTKGSRDSTPVCLVPAADGLAVISNDVALVDYSHAEDGYICVSYTGTCSKVKLRITGSDSVTYTYNLHGDGYETFPLSAGSGSYDIGIYENIVDTNYSTCLFDTISVNITNPFGPFLYPNQYVNFTAGSKTVQKGAELAASADTDLEVVTNVYDYITSNITYDYDKASDPPTGYTSNVDEILASNKGICLDYAAVMASMLRSQRIPTRLEVGYAADAYHAWISVYIADVGWMNGIIQFNGSVWTLIDPTFGAGSDNEELKQFIGDGSNYILQKMY